jgi:hypothetical protein
VIYLRQREGSDSAFGRGDGARKHNLQLGHDCFDIRHPSKPEGKIQQARQVHLLGDAAGASGGEKDTVIAEISIASRGFATHVGHDPCDNDIFHFQTAQNGFQVDIVESLVTVF